MAASSMSSTARRCTQSSRNNSATVGLHRIGSASGKLCAWSSSRPRQKCSEASSASATASRPNRAASGEPRKPRTSRLRSCSVSGGTASSAPARAGAGSTASRAPTSARWVARARRRQLTQVVGDRQVPGHLAAHPAGSSVRNQVELVLGAHLPDLFEDPLGRAADEEILRDADVVVDQGHQGVLRAALGVVIGEGGEVRGLVAVHVAVGPDAGEVDPPELAGPPAGVSAPGRTRPAPAASGTRAAKIARMVVAAALRRREVAARKPVTNSRTAVSRSVSATAYTLPSSAAPSISASG